MQLLACITIDPHGELKGVNVLTAVGTDRSDIMADFGIAGEAELDAYLERARKVCINVPLVQYSCPSGRGIQLLDIKLKVRHCFSYLYYTLRPPVMGEVLSTRIWGVPPAGGPLL